MRKFFLFFSLIIVLSSTSSISFALEQETVPTTLQKLINDFNKKQIPNKQLSPENTPKRYAELVSTADSHPKKLELSNLRKGLIESMAAMGITPLDPLYDYTLQSLMVMHSEFEGTNMESPSFVYGVNLFQMSKDINLMSVKDIAELSDATLNKGNLIFILADQASGDLLETRLNSEHPLSFVEADLNSHLKSVKEEFRDLKKMIFPSQNITKANLLTLRSSYEQLLQFSAQHPAVYRPALFNRLLTISDSLAKSPLALERDKAMLGQTKLGDSSEYKRSLLFENLLSSRFLNGVQKEEDLIRLEKIASLYQKLIQGTDMDKLFHSNPEFFKSWMNGMMNLPENTDLEVVFSKYEDTFIMLTKYGNPPTLKATDDDQYLDHAKDFPKEIFGGLVLDFATTWALHHNASIQKRDLAVAYQDYLKSGNFKPSLVFQNAREAIQFNDFSPIDPFHQINQDNGL